MNRFKEHAKKRSAAGWVAPVVIVMLCLAWAAPAGASDMETPLQFTFAPYAWLAGIDGDVTARGQKVDVDVDFSDIWDDLDFGGMLYLEGNYDRWGVFANTVYVKLTPDENTPLGKVDVTSKSWIVDFGFLFRLMGYREEGETIDLVLGGRYWDQSNKLKVNFPDAGIDDTFKKSNDWVDPIIGLRYMGWFTDNFGLSIRGDVGGFDIFNDSSDLTWSAQGLLNYRIADAIDLYAGYRGLGVDHTEGSGADRFKLDVTMHGPIIGMGFLF